MIKDILTGAATAVAGYLVGVFCASKVQGKKFSETNSEIADMVKEEVSKAYKKVKEEVSDSLTKVRESDNAADENTEAETE